MIRLRCGVFFLAVILSQPIPLSASDFDSEKLSFDDANRGFESTTGATCGNILLVGGSTAYYLSRLTDTGGYHLSKPELITLFALKERAQKDPKRTTNVSSSQEQKLLEILLNRKVKMGEELSYQDLTEKIMMGAFQRLGFSFARKIKALYPQMDIDDLVQVAMIGIYQTILIYDYRDKHMFSSWAYNTMHSQLTKVYSAQMTHWKLADLTRVRQVIGSQRKLRSSLGRLPTAAEIEQVLREKYIATSSLETIERIIWDLEVEGATQSEFNAFDTSLDSDDQNFKMLMTVDLLVDEVAESIEDQVDIKKSREGLAKVIATTLSEEERRYLELQFGFSIYKDGEIWMMRSEGEEKNMAEVGRLFGITRSSSSFTMRSILRKMKHPARTQYLSHPRIKIQ